MPDKPLIIIGGGGHACIVAEAARLSGWSIVGHVSLEAGTDPLLAKWLGEDAVLNRLLAQGAVCALGLGFVNVKGAQRRSALIYKLNVNHLATIIHPGASVAGSARLGAGCFVGAQAVIGTRASLGTGVLVNTSAIVEHHNTVKDGAHIATGATLTGTVTVGKDVLIGAGAIVRQGLEIGDGAIVGAGCVVLTDVPPGALWGGNPGRAL
jgi:sugar O-acyltransferase (sialic acid O-acetyltransferase NeuD family)